MDKGKTDIIPEIDLVAETEVPTIIMAVTEEMTKTRTIMVLEIIEIGTEIPRIIDPIIEEKILAKGMTKDLDIRVSVESMTDPDPGIGVPSRENFENRYRNNQSRSRERQMSRTTSRERHTRSRSRSSS